MKLKVIAVLALAVLFTTSAWAQTKTPQDLPSSPGTEQDCDLTDYVSVCGPGTTIDSAEALLTSDATTAGDTFGDVILELIMDQTWVGDLIAQVSYDENNDGTADYGPVSALCRPDLTGCGDTGCCGCSGDVSGSYKFADDAPNPPLGEGAGCFSFMPEGCYQIAPESTETFASAFGGKNTGGSFLLRMRDGAAGDPLTLAGWCVWFTTGAPTPTVDTTWGQVKALYR
jgi:hypothetical protein